MPIFAFLPPISDLLEKPLLHYPLKSQALRPGKQIRQQKRNGQAEDYGWEDGILRAEKRLFKWRLEESIGSAPRMSS